MATIQAAYIDDERPMLELAKEFLEMDGSLKVDVFDVVYDAFSALSNKSYDVIVCDYQMPEMNGIQVLKVLRENGERVPFILFTGKGREEVAIEALNLGANRYIQKGGDVRSLFMELRHAVEQLTKQMRAESELERSNRELETLFKATGKLMGVTDLESIGDIMYEAVHRVLEADMIILSSYDPSTKTFMTEAAILDGHRLDRSHFSPSTILENRECMQSQVIHSSQPIIIPDLDIMRRRGGGLLDEGVLKLIEETGGHANRLRSCVLLPLRYEGEVIGVLQVMSRLEQYFCEKHLRFLEPLASNAAAALALSRLHKAAKLELERRGQAELLRTLMAAMIDACENGIMIWHFSAGKGSIHPVVWNPAAARLLFGNEGEGFSTLKDCSTLLSHDLDALAREALRRGRSINILTVKKSGHGSTPLEVTLLPLNAEHIGLIIIER
ncbi:MAG: response regulator [Methanomassiliicoccales archaeon]